jgi:hypothetical protein
MFPGYAPSRCGWTPQRVVTGTADPATVQAAIRQAGYTATALPDGTPAGGTPADSVADHDGTREVDR